MISVWGAVVVFNLLIHFVVPDPQYQYQSPYYLHFPPIPYNQIEINGPVNSNNIPPWLLQQGNLGIQNQTNNLGLPQVGPTVGSLRVQLPNPPVPYANQLPQALNNGSLMYYLSGPWGGSRSFAQVNNNVDNSIVTTTPANWQNLPAVTPGDYTANRQQQPQQQQQFAQFNPQQQFYQEQQFNSLQGNQFPQFQQQFGQQQQAIQQGLNGQQQQVQQFNQGQQQQDFNRDQSQPPQTETSSQNPNGPVSWNQQGAWGWSAWDAYGPPPVVTASPNSDGSSAAPGRGLLTKNAQRTTEKPTTTTKASTTTTTSSTFAGATDSIAKLRRIVSRIRDITREELAAAKRGPTDRSLRRSASSRKTTTSTTTTTNKPNQ